MSRWKQISTNESQLTNNISCKIKGGTSEWCSFTDVQSKIKSCLSCCCCCCRTVIMCDFFHAVIFIFLSMNSAGGHFSHVAPLCRPSCPRRSSWPRSGLRSTRRCRTCGPSACWVTVTASGSSTCPPSSGRRAPRCARCTRRTTSSNTWRTARWCCRTRWGADRVEGWSGLRVLFCFVGPNSSEASEWFCVRALLCSGSLTIILSIN